MGLYPEDIERVEPHDSQADVETVIKELSAEQKQSTKICQL